MIADLENDGIEARAPPLSGFAFEKLEQLDLDRFPFCFGAVLFGQAEMFAQGGSLSGGHGGGGDSRAPLRLAADLDQKEAEYAVDDQVGVASDGRSEMRVVGSCSIRSDHRA